MSRIKTRERVKDIKLLDRPALAGQRMKDAYIRTKKQLSEESREQQRTPDEYAGDMVQDTAADVLSYTGHKAASGTKWAARQGVEKVWQHHAKKGISMQRNHAPTAYRNPDLAAPLRRSGETTPAPHTPLERGRAYAKKQAAQRAAAAKQTLYTDSSRPIVQPTRPLIKTREHVEGTPQRFGSTPDTAKPHSVRQQASKTVRCGQTVLLRRHSRRNGQSELYGRR